jgi:hypothetical protein
MSGWIPFEKDLWTDPRFLRFVDIYHGQQHEPEAEFGNAPPFQVHAPCNACAFTCAGMLLKFWCYADTHIDEDDTLQITAQELCRMMEWSDFAPAMEKASRQHWLVMADDYQSVKLPNYQEHNGMEAKARFKTQKRVERLRKRKGVTSETQERYIENHARRNAPSLPHHTKPDQTNIEKESTTIVVPKKAAEPNGHRLPEDFALTTTRTAVGRDEGLQDVQRTFAKFRDHWTAATGANARKRDWDAAWRNWCRTEADRQNRPGATTPRAWSTRPTQESALAAIEAAAGSDSEDNQGDGYIRIVDV